MNAVLLCAALLAGGGVLVAISGRQELRQRWASWVGAAAVLYAATHAPHGMTALAVALSAVAGFELARMLVPAGPARVVCWTAAVGATVLGTQLPRPWLAAAVLLGAVAFRVAVVRRTALGRLALAASLVGLPLAALAVLPVTWVVPSMLAVSIGDVAAWVGGRTVGRRGWLAGGLSRWSPNKTRAGALVSVLAGGAVLACFGQWWLAPVVPVAGIMGDLRESQVKRRAGVKDAGTWLPGFGGMLDRIDSILGALVGLCAVAAAPAHPVLVAVIVVLLVPGAWVRRVLWRTAFAGAGGLTVRGTLPAGSCVVVAQHRSHADSAALLAALDAAHAPRVAAAADYWFRSPFRAAVCRGLVGGFAVRRTGGGMADLLAAGEHLRHGGAVVVYPEGSRDASGCWHGGAFRLAHEFDVPVVPVVIDGTDRLLPKSGRFTRRHVTVTVGDPIPTNDPATVGAAAQKWLVGQA